jgi:hypothetical protein
MPIIELELSDKIYLRWQKFLGTQQAGRLKEAGLLGDWAAQGFLNNVNSYLKDGGPPELEDQDARRQRLEAEARRRLNKNQKRVLPMFDEAESIIVAEVGQVLGLLPGDAALLVEQWLGEDFLTPAGERDGEAAYTLSRSWQERNLAANRPSLNAPRMLHISPVSKPRPNKN